MMSDKLSQGKRFRESCDDHKIPRIVSWRRDESYRALKRDMSVDDLGITSVESLIKEQVELKCSEWEKLDNRYLHKRPIGSAGMPGGSSHLSIPSDMDIFNGDRSNLNSLCHHNIPEPNKDVYLNKLFDIFTSVPRYKAIKSRIFTQNLTRTDGSLANEEKTDISKLPVLVETLQEKSTWENEVIVEIKFSSSKSEYNKKSTEIEALGRQTLFDLMNHFYCYHDFSISGDRCGIFFIEGVFYVEGMDRNGAIPPSALLTINNVHSWICQDNDLSQNLSPMTPIADLQVDKQAIGFKSRCSNSSLNRKKCISRTHKFNVSNLDSTLPDVRSIHTPLESINFLPEKRYLYLHKGLCEHFVYFTNIRTYSKVRDLGVSAYPKTTQFELLHRRKCGVCVAISAKYLVFGDKMVDSNPFYFCEHCFFQLHYDEKGHLIYDDFHVFPYNYDLV